MIQDILVSGVVSFIICFSMEKYYARAADRTLGEYEEGLE